MREKLRAVLRRMGFPGWHRHQPGSRQDIPGQLGRVVVDGRSYPVTRLRFTGGKLEIIAQRRGPDPAVSGLPVTVFGADGKGVFQGGQCQMDAVAAGDTAPLQLLYTFSKITDEPPAS